MSISTSLGALPGHWVTDEEACKYWPACATLTDAPRATNVMTSFFMSSIPRCFVIADMIHPAAPWQGLCLRFPI